MVSLHVAFCREDRVYHPGETVSGAVVVMDAVPPFSHSNVSFSVAGTVVIHPMGRAVGRAVGMLESFYSGSRTINIFETKMEIRKCEKRPPGELGVGGGREEEMLFEFRLDSAVSPLLPTYHGSYININYHVKVEMKRSGILHRSLTATSEFIVEKKREGIVPRGVPSSEPINFVITPDTRDHPLGSFLRGAGGFRISGTIASMCSIWDPLIGDVVIDSSAVAIKSIDIQLMRVESSTQLVGERMAREVTEVQSTEVAVGDVCREMKLPIYVLLPRLLTCPTVVTENFAVEFEVNIRVTFDVETKLKIEGGVLKGKSKRQQNVVVTETLPLRIVAM